MRTYNEILGSDFEKLRNEYDHYRIIATPRQQEEEKEFFQWIQSRYPEKAAVIKAAIKADLAAQRAEMMEDDNE